MSHPEALAPCCIWLTGLPSSGKTSIASSIALQLGGQGIPVLVLDGDQVRGGLCSDLGFSRADREENLRRASEVAKLCVDAGMIVVCAFISPYESTRQAARARFSDFEFVLVHVDCPVDVCIQRDPKGLYARAFAGELADFTGVDAPFEHPAGADFVVTTSGIEGPAASAESILSFLAG